MPVIPATREAEAGENNKTKHNFSSVLNKEPTSGKRMRDDNNSNIYNLDFCFVTVKKTLYVAPRK